MNWLDYLIAIALVFGLVRGLMKGFAVSVTSFVALYVALFLGFKLMHQAAAYWDSAFELSGVWLPFIGFISVFVLVLVLILMLGRLLDKLFKAVALGIVNRLAGGLFGLLQFGFLVGLLLWLVQQVDLIDPSSTAASWLYPYAITYTETIIDWGSKLLPMVGDLLGEIEALFAEMSDTLPKPS